MTILGGQISCDSFCSSKAIMTGRFGFLRQQDVNVTMLVMIGKRIIGSFIISVLKGAKIVTVLAIILLNPNAVPVN